MRKLFRENLKVVIAVTVLFVLTAALIGTNELIAVMLPDASELKFVSCELKDVENVVYTGSELKPEFESFVFEDKEGQIVEVIDNDFEILSYMNNVEIGKADVTVALEGYRNEITVEDAFEIILGKVKELQIISSSKEKVELSWSTVPGATGYKVHKSDDNGETFTVISDINEETTVHYTDASIELNSTYIYKVNAVVSDLDNLMGEFSDEIIHVTPLETVEISSAKNKSNDSIKIAWKRVAGAAGYEVYRMESKDGESSLIAEIRDGEEISYVDKKCTLGKTYYYFVKACQKIGEEIILGESSDVITAKTSLGKVSLNGSTNAEKTKVSLSWKKVNGADGYEIYRSIGDGNYKLVKTISGADSLSWAESDLTSTKEYVYKVRAFATVEGKNMTGAYSGTYEKTAKINYNYSSAGSGSMSGATKYVGYQYVYGGKSTSGWDCSGFVYWVMKNEYGIDISTSASGQASGGSRVSVNDRSSWKPGDVLCYKNDKGQFKHVAIYLGDGKMIHALNAKYDTFIQNVDTYEKWDSNTLTSVKRYF